MSILKKLAGQTAIYGSSVILSRLLNVAFTPLYTGIFPPELYGIYTNLYAYVALVNVVLTFGMETTFFRFLQDQQDPRKIYGQAFFWVASLSLTFVALSTALHPLLASWMGYAGQESYLLYLIAIIFLDVLAALPLAKLRQEERVKWFAGVTIINVIVTLVANLIFVYWLRMGIEYVFISNLLASVIRLGMALWKNLPTRLRPDFRLLRRMLDYAWFIMIAGVAGIMNETLDRIMIPFRWEDGTWMDGVAQSGEALNGIYGANYKVAMLIALATQAFRYAAEPFFFKEESQKDSPKTFARVFHYFMLAALTGFLLIASFAQEIVSFDLFGLTQRSFVDRAYWSGIKVIPILLAAYVFSAAYINLSIWFKITKQTRFAILFTGVGAIITVTINYFGIPHFGYMASAWATLACYAVMCVMVYVVGQRHYPVPYPVGRLLGYTALFVGGLLVNQEIGPSDGFWLASWMKVGICLLLIGTVVALEKWIPVKYPLPKPVNRS